MPKVFIRKIEFSELIYRCVQCPHYKRLTNEVNAIIRCRETGEIIESQGWGFPIPPWCPLEESKEVENAKNNTGAR